MRDINESTQDTPYKKRAHTRAQFRPVATHPACQWSELPRVNDKSWRPARLRVSSGNVGDGSANKLYSIGRSHPAPAARYSALRDSEAVHRDTVTGML